MLRFITLFKFETELQRKLETEDARIETKHQLNLKLHKAKTTSATTIPKATPNSAQNTCRKI